MIEEALKTAAIHLLEGRLDDCHAIVQENEVPDGNYLHAVLHRMEKDFSNSLYWYRRAATHPVRQEMDRQYPGWSPERLVSLCESEPHAAQTAAQEKAELEAIRKHYGA